MSPWVVHVLCSVLLKDTVKCLRWVFNWRPFDLKSCYEPLRSSSPSERIPKKLKGTKITKPELNMKSATILELNQASGVRVVLCTKKLHFVSWNWRKEN